MKKLSSLMLLALVFILLGCRQENSLIEKEQQSKNVKISVLEYDQVQSQKSLINKISDLESKAFKKGMAAKSVQDSLFDGAIIETNKVLLIEDGDQKTYTFPVSRIYPNNKIENLVLRKNEDNSYSGALFQYSLTEIEKQKYIKGIPIDLAGKIKSYTINDISINNKGGTYSYYEGCLEYVYETHPCAGNEHHGVGAACPLAGTPSQAQPNTIIAAINHCGEESGGGSGSGSTGPGGEGSPGSPPGSGTIGGGSGGGSGSAQPLNPYNTFMFISYDDLYILCAEGDSQCAINWANMSATVNVFTALNRNGLMLPSYTATFNLVKDYLVANNFSPDAKAFISERLNIVGNWLRFQDNSTDEKLLKNHQFAHWALKYLAFENPDASSHFKLYPEDVKKIKFKGLDYNNYFDENFANKFASAFTEILIAEKNNTVSQINIQDLTWKAAKDYMIYLIKQNAASAVKYGRVIYEHASQYFSQHPNSLQKVNEFIEYLKVGVETEAQVITNPKYMKWTDILLCWLFEIGDYPINDSAGYGNIPTIGFSGLDYTISGSPPPNIIPMRYLSAHKMKNGLPDANSVLDLRKRAIDQIKYTGSTTPLNDEWVFGSDATVETITKLDGMQFCLGSYRTDVFINALGNNQYKLTYIIKNKTGWQSGTRGLNDYNGNPLDDSIIPDKPRGTGIHLGGTIGETFGWQEIITVP